MEDSTARATQVVAGLAPTSPMETLTGDGEFKSLATTVQFTIPQATKQETPNEIQSNGVIQPPISTDEVEAPITVTIGTTEVEVPTSMTSVHLPITNAESEEHSTVLVPDGPTPDEGTETPLPTTTSSDDFASRNETLNSTIASSPDVGTLTTINSTPVEKENEDTTVYDPEDFKDSVLATFDETVEEVGLGNSNSQDTVNAEVSPSVIIVSPNTDLESPSSGLKKIITGLNFTNVSTSTKPSTSAATTTLEPEPAEGAAALDTPLAFSSFGSSTSVLLVVVIGFGLIMG